MQEAGAPSLLEAPHVCGYLVTLILIVSDRKSWIYDDEKLFITIYLRGLFTPNFWVLLKLFAF